MLMLCYPIPAAMLFKYIWNVRTFVFSVLLRTLVFFAPNNLQLWIWIWYLSIWSKPGTISCRRQAHGSLISQWKLYSMMNVHNIFPSKNFLLSQNRPRRVSMHLLYVTPVSACFQCDICFLRKHYGVRDFTTEMI